MRLLASFVRVSAWERVSTWRRLLCAFARVAVLFLVIFLIGFFFYANRFQLAAELWHWRHGNKTIVGNYEVPVPAHWLITDINYSDFTIINTSPNFPRDGEFHTTAVITVFPFRNWPVEANRIGFWLSVERQQLAREDAKDIEEKTVKAGGESFTCIGGRRLDTILRKAAPNVHVPEIDAVSLNCMSGRGLNVLFVGEPSDVEAFYSFLSQIRPKGEALRTSH